MSYQVLARKWRPATFDQVVGQSHVLHALTNALSQQRLHHAYLFTGTRGVGKTSLARLFAKGLNCETGVTAHPCGQCASCKEIAQGRFVDLIEVDAASRTKVDDTRELLDNVQYRPTRGRFKVYLIDEVHMLSRSSFNALLKTLEEPPEHVKFLLATTDPQKLPVTVLSRCLQFNLKSLSLDDISGQLDHVLSAEQVPFEASALTLLAKAANGSMRDALSLTDQAIAFGAGQVMHEQVQTMLGSIDEQQVLVLLNALLTGDIANLMQLTAQALSFGADADEVLRSLLELLHQITLTQFAPAAAQLSLYSEQITGLAQQLKPEQVQLYYQILLTGRKDLPHAADPKSGLEMALLRAVAFLPEPPATHWDGKGAASPGKAEPAGGTTGTAMHTVAKMAPLASHSQQSNTIASVDTESVKPSSTVRNIDTAIPEDVATDDDVTVMPDTSSPDALTPELACTDPLASTALNVSEASVEVASVVANTVTDEARDTTYGEVPEAVSSEAISSDSAVSVDVADEADVDAMAAEQALLLSQAQSMGYQSTIAALPDECIPAQQEYQSQIKDNLVEQATSFTSSSDIADTTTIPATNMHQLSGDSSKSELSDNHQAEPSAQLEQVQASDAVSSDVAGNELTDELVMYQQYADSQVVDESSLPDLSGLQFEPTSQPQAVVPWQHQAEVAPFDDDLLDAVLAARSSLLAGISSNEPAEEELVFKAPASRIQEPNTSVTQKDVCDAKASTTTESETVASGVPLSTEDVEVSSVDLVNTAENALDKLASEAASQQTSIPVDNNQSANQSDIASSASMDFSDGDDDGYLDYLAATSAPSSMDMSADDYAAYTAQSDLTSSNDAISEQRAAALERDGSDADRPPWELPSQAVMVEKASKSANVSSVLKQQSKPIDSVKSAPVANLELGSNVPGESRALQQSDKVEVNAEALPTLASSVAITGHSLDLHWYKLMAALKIGGRVRQLAVNSVCQQWGDEIVLLLKPDQKHLAAAAAVAQLQDALVEALGHAIRVEMAVGMDSQRETPREVRTRFHHELLQQAKAQLYNDDNIRWLHQVMGAQLDDDTISYPPELLSQRSQQIPALPAGDEMKTESGSEG